MDSEDIFDPQRYPRTIRSRGLSIYEPIEIGDPDLWIPALELEYLLDAELTGISLAGYALRTRSKIVKEHICRVLGYPVPASFKKTQPRFPGQMFDTFVQKSNNLQIWNEELASTRRYVILRVDNDDTISKVKVVTGDVLSLLDTTGTLTQKYQARCIPGTEPTDLVSHSDTEVLERFVSASANLGRDKSPIMHPAVGEILPISEIFERLSGLVGQQFKDVGHDQERNRGAALHRLVCKVLGYEDYRDAGQFPDIRHQLVEVKLQTSPTIDLGLVCPNSTEPLDVPQIESTQIRHCDVRYAIFYGMTDGLDVKITNFMLANGEDFFSRFPQFQGKVLNKKLQIRLPSSFFES